MRKQIKYFQTIVCCGSFMGAAKACCIGIAAGRIPWLDRRVWRRQI